MAGFPFHRRFTGLAVLWALAAAFLMAPAQAGERGYYRFPAALGDALIFASEGDLWRAVAGGKAVRLTTHPELESAPALSPDGKTVAFNATYDGGRDVYVMAAEGGAPRRLTFEGGTQVRGWTPEGKVLFSSGSRVGPYPVILRIVDPKTGKVETLPFEGAKAGVFSADGKTVFFTRFGLDRFGDNVTSYRGGGMAQLWKADLAGTEEAVRLAPDFNAPIRHPMVWGDRLFFLSDKGGSDNIWSMAFDGTDLGQITDFSGWQLRTPSMGKGMITYQRGADLYSYDIASGRETKRDITLISDREAARKRWLEKPLDYLETARPGARAEAAAITARGRIVVARTGARRRVELAVPAGARARGAVIGAKGDWVYTILDQDRFGEIWRYPATGIGAPEQMTAGNMAHIWALYPAPDGSKLLYQDKRGRLWSLDLETKKTVRLEKTESTNDRAFADFAWSSGGRYVAYRISDRRDIARVAIRDFETGKRHVVTRGKYESAAPAFSPDGGWLYFISNRTFRPSPSNPWRDRSMGTSFDKRGKIYALQLDPEADFPFRPEDELQAAAKAAEEEAAEEKDEDGGDGQEDTDDAGDKGEDADGDGADDDDGEDERDEKDTEIVFEGLMDRLWTVPADADNYTGLKANSDFLFVLVTGRGPATLKSVKVDPVDPAMETFAGNVRSFDLSADGETVFLQQGRGADTAFAFVPAGGKAPDDLKDKALRIEDWRLEIDPRAEWRQMLLDAWRMHRDFAYDPKLRGLEWDAIRDKYLPLVERLGHRDELDDLLGRMVAELSILHSQIRSGDEPDDAENPTGASLGAEVKGHAKGLEITLIYGGEADLPDQLGPLAGADTDVRVGDVLSAVDGRRVRTEADLALALLNKAGQRVRLDLRRGDETVSAIVEPAPASALFSLRYRHWVEENRKRVAEASKGTVGYLHLRAMGGRDLASFARDFYAHFDKDGIIIDVRSNFGGNIDSMLLTVLLRRAWAFWTSPVGGDPYTNMQQAFRGHLAVLIDQNTYSDGETFAAGVKALDLAPLIGTRTAGAGIWLTSRNRLVDNGQARVAEFPQFTMDGRWLIEGQGVSPDIEVINPPRESFAGADAQLDAALGYLADRIEASPIPPLRPKPLPPVGVPGNDVN